MFNSEAVYEKRGVMELWDLAGPFGTYSPYDILSDRG
jgi:hypothetical protein